MKEAQKEKPQAAKRGPPERFGTSTPKGPKACGIDPRGKLQPIKINREGKQNIAPCTKIPIAKGTTTNGGSKEGPRTQLTSPKPQGRVPINTHPLDIEAVSKGEASKGGGLAVEGVPKNLNGPVDSTAYSHKLKGQFSELTESHPEVNPTVAPRCLDSS